jgi:hypothetical protein
LFSSKKLGARFHFFRVTHRDMLNSSASGQLSIFYPMRLIGVSADPRPAIGFVL